MKKGFTIVELLIVIVIIAILVALLIPAIGKAICAAKEGRGKALLTNISTSLENYKTDFYGRYPPMDAGLGSCKLFCIHNPTDPQMNFLGREGPKKLPYIIFKNEDCVSHPSGIMDPADPTDWIHYRNNQMQPPPAGAKNTKTYDLWCKGCTTDSAGAIPPDDVNNWK